MIFPMRLTWCFLVVLLAGCGIDTQSELQMWMEEQRAVPAPKLAVMPEPTQFAPQPYLQSGSADPFSAQKLLLVLKRESPEAVPQSILITNEQKRRKEPLEQYPLDGMSMVGSLLQKVQPVALIKVDKQIHQVKVGQHIGFNFGKVLKITESEVTLREVVQDPAGDWVERTTKMQLQEAIK